MNVLHELKADLSAFIAEKYADNPKVQDLDEAYKVAAILAVASKGGAVPAIPAHTAAEGLPSTFNDFAALIERELDEAEQFISYYKQARTEEWKALAKYRTSGAKYFIDKAAVLVTDPEQQQRVKDWSALQGVLNNQLPR